MGMLNQGSLSEPRRYCLPTSAIGQMNSGREPVRSGARMRILYRHPNTRPPRESMLCRIIPGTRHLIGVLSPAIRALFRNRFVPLNIQSKPRSKHSCLLRKIIGRGNRNQSGLFRERIRSKKSTILPRRRSRYSVDPRKYEAALTDFWQACDVCDTFKEGSSCNGNDGSDHAGVYAG